MTEFVNRLKFKVRVWWWRRLKCALGFHGWMMGPWDGKGGWRNEAGEIVPMPTDFTPYACCFGYPRCRATKRVPR